MMRIRHWQDVASLVVGVWLVLSPFALGFAGAEVWITRAWVVRHSVCHGGICHSVQSGGMGEILIGLALVAVPWTVVYQSVSATASSVVSGILVILLAAWELTTDRDFSTWWHDRWHHSAS